jgi:hypothetical protein
MVSGPLWGWVSFNVSIYLSFRCWDDILVSFALSWFLVFGRVLTRLDFWVSIEAFFSYNDLDTGMSERISYSNRRKNMSVGLFGFGYTTGYFMVFVIY